MNTTFNPYVLNMMHKECIKRWTNQGIDYTQTSIYQLAEENHAFNFQLWNAEDRARRDDMGFEFVYQAKREIDYFNQQRNNRMEAMDEWFFHAVRPATAAECPVHSETPGMMIDRLSILSLKSYHMELQTTRTEVNEEHKNNCARKLVTINEQLTQLTQCLDELLDDVVNKKRTFRVYHQFKMYNDPNLNPQLYHPQEQLQHKNQD